MERQFESKQHGRLTFHPVYLIARMEAPYTLDLVEAAAGKVVDFLPLPESTSTRP